MMIISDENFEKMKKISKKDFEYWLDIIMDHQILMQNKIENEIIDKINVGEKLIFKKTDGSILTCEVIENSLESIK